MATDLTWAQVDAALGSNGAISLDSNGLLIITPSLITGDSYDALTDSGVVEFMHKLREACSVAQATVNTGVAAGSRLAAFPPSTATAPVNNSVTVTGQVISRIPLDLSTVTGNTI